MSLVSIGPVNVAFHGDPQFSWKSQPTSRSGRPASISGLVEWDDAHELSELVANTDAQTTVGDATGVLEWVTFNDTKLSPFTGYYLLTDYSIDPDHRSSVTAEVGFSLSGVYLGDVA